MCLTGCNSPGEDAGVPGGAPGGSTEATALCCTCPTSGQVSEQSRGRYFSVSGYSSSQKTNKCLIDIQRTTSAGVVTVTKSFSLSYASGATEAADKAGVTATIATGMSNWTGGASAFKVKIEQPGCDPQELRMVFQSSIVASGADVSATVYGTAAPTPPLSVTGGTALAYYVNRGGNMGWRMTHELGHTFGLPDEYCTVPGVPIVPTPAPPAEPITPPAVSPTTTYIGSPPQADDTITQVANFPSSRTIGSYVFDHPTVMGQTGNTTYKKYMFFWVAIEVKKLLADANTPATVTIV